MLLRCWCGSYAVYIYYADSDFFLPFLLDRLTEMIHLFTVASLAVYKASLSARILIW